MKKVVIITFALFAMLIISCTNDSANPGMQSGSVWRTASITDSSMSSAFEYYEIRFITASTFELWVKRVATENPEKVNQNYRYDIKDNAISIVYDNATTAGTIDKSSMSINENGMSLKFVKI